MASQTHDRDHLDMSVSLNIHLPVTLGNPCFLFWPTSTVFSAKCFNKLNCLWSFKRAVMQSSSVCTFLRPRCSNSHLTLIVRLMDYSIIALSPRHPAQVYFKCSHCMRTSGSVRSGVWREKQAENTISLHSSSSLSTL